MEQTLTTTDEHAADVHTPDAHDDAHHDHPSDKKYIQIALWLAFFTLIEVGTYFESVHNLPAWSLYVILTFLMIVKFVIVGAFFMHLKFDDKMYTRMFVAGLVLAVIVYLIALFASNLFG